MSYVLRVQELKAGHWVGPYQLLCPVASGGMAEVWLGRRSGPGAFAREVALKTPLPRLLCEEDVHGMLADEARLSAAFSHPNLLVVHSLLQDDAGRPFLVMDYVEGVTLATLHAHGAMAPDVALRIAYDVLLGLSAAHSLRLADGSLANLVHRDVSPQNVLVGSDGYARLGDFGIARSDERITRTHTGVMKGRLAYMSPERLLGRPIDLRTDLFGVGVILWEALTGQRLFGARSDWQIIESIVRGRAPQLSELRPELAPLDVLLARALAVDPVTRYASADRMAEVIEEIAPRVGGLATPRRLAEITQHVAGARFREIRESAHVATAIIDASQKRVGRIRYRELASQEASLERRRASSRPPDLIFDPLATEPDGEAFDPRTLMPPPTQTEVELTVPLATPSSSPN